MSELAEALVAWFSPPPPPAPSPAPDAFDTLVVDLPARAIEQSGDPAVAVPAVLRSKIDDVPSQELFTVRDLRS